MSSSTPQPATADTGYITQPGPLENTYTSDIGLRRALGCEYLVRLLTGIHINASQGTCHLLLCDR